MFSVVTQNAQIFNSTIRANIEYGKAGASDEEIKKAASLAELTFDDDFSLDKDVGKGYSKIDRPKNVWHGKMCCVVHAGEGGGMLSGGQQQRVALVHRLAFLFFVVGYAMLFYAGSGNAEERNSLSSG